jgi:sec-independent protein translocase protein TatA
LNETDVVLAEIIGPDLLIIFLIVSLLFGSSQLPKLARSIGQASKEFRQGLLGGSEPNSGSGRPAVVPGFVPVVAPSVPATADESLR